jgi:hypothetical protein
MRESAMFIFSFRIPLSLLQHIVLGLVSKRKGNGIQVIPPPRRRRSRLGRGAVSGQGAVVTLKLCGIDTAAV